MTYPNWFKDSSAIHYFEKYLKKFSNKEVSFLQIGVFTGDATEWLFENVLTNNKSTLTDVDTWTGSDNEGHSQFNWNEIESIYDNKFKDKILSKNLLKYKMSSNEFFSKNNNQYDFIYIDGDHKALSVLLDGTNAFFNLKSGGILAFDDYLWTLEQFPFNDPKPGIDSFLNIFGGQYYILDIQGQAWIEKR